MPKDNAWTETLLLFASILYHFHEVKIFQSSRRVEEFLGISPRSYTKENNYSNQ